MALASKTLWGSAGLLAYSVAGYPLLLRAMVGLRGAREAPVPAPSVLSADGSEAPRVAMLVAAHDEEAVIEGWVGMARGLEWPAERIELIVAADGCSDRTAELARAAGADRVIEVSHGGKVAALHAALDVADAPDVLAFSDANSLWRPDALRRLVGRLAEPAIGYVCGRLELTDASGDNQEGLYWRYEMAIRHLESELGGITAGNGAINVVRAAAFSRLEPDRGLDISLPFELTKRGWSALYEPEAVATEPMATTISDEFGRKRRMLTGSWRTLLSTGMLSPRGYPPLYWLEILSHRLLRYAAPVLHAKLLVASMALAPRRPIGRLALGVQLGFAALAALGSRAGRPGLIARYYATVQAASALGLWDFLRRGAPRTWKQAGGTRPR
ncbi:glycosyltransferase [Thermoleophilia bacterium SCSIO 60948]|nr:glycosyltransferase [Thermoleophilia bacterium SCSIO 60948]